MTEQLPAAVTEDLDRLRAALAAAIPARTASNLLVGTWNIRALGDLTAKWLAGPKDSPKRDWHAIACLAEVISRFDVVAVQESRRNPAALKTAPGQPWPPLAGHHLGCDRRGIRQRPTPRLPVRQHPGPARGPGRGDRAAADRGDDPQRQFARTPYTASFSRAGVEFTLASVHIL
ncbi:hypothetical protein [Arthrobacter sp. ES3-54]|uniref:hypothetical protein n=1 Tax=Arthrobacter sp. ES3-54 TaxID=1502991 RepID=UPI0024051AF9|nr:hypothetical protein [Arthrobacter sp. ES3-54]MDF9749056.1 hypothetical protein [Arthrobacter sp. ES3-54]